jgi:hypothetical protein
VRLFRANTPNDIFRDTLQNEEPVSLQPIRTEFAKAIFEHFPETEFLSPGLPTKQFKDFDATNNEANRILEYFDFLGGYPHFSPAKATARNQSLCTSFFALQKKYIALRKQVATPSSAPASTPPDTEPASSPPGTKSPQVSQLFADTELNAFITT